MYFNTTGCSYNIYIYHTLALYYTILLISPKSNWVVLLHLVGSWTL